MGVEEAFARGDHVHPLSSASSAIPYEKVDSTSISTAFKATISGITDLVSGQCIMLMNDKATSSSGATLNVNNLGAKPIYITNAAGTGVSNRWKLGYTALFVYNTTRVANGCWDFCALWDTDTVYDLDDYGIGSSECRSAESTLDKVVYWTNYRKLAGQIFFISFKYNVPTGSTLNINDKGATPLYIGVPGGFNGTDKSNIRPIETGDILAGDRCMILCEYFTSGGYYYTVIGIDRFMLTGSSSRPTAVLPTIVSPLPSGVTSAVVRGARKVDSIVSITFVLSKMQAL